MFYVVKTVTVGHNMDGSQGSKKGFKSIRHESGQMSDNESFHVETYLMEYK
ncbi:hypothetical protein [Lactobacillus agrestimuris]|uniref:hypothetical protein n=1 Tax=Lactobacillus agrestimuris TaxID=2941328 RepID=UPI00204413CC|nr:hypothetical protein [Lactobacillus agrestimuris]